MLRCVRGCLLSILGMFLAGFPVRGQDPGAASSLLLVGGEINGQGVTAGNAKVTVSPGAAISGNFTVSINSAWPSNDVMAMGVTPTWGPPATSFTDLGGFGTPVSGLQRAIPVNVTAPTVPGTYYIIAAFRAEYTAAEVMSCTNWQVGYINWNSGYAVADWSASTISTADSAGTVLVNYLFPGGNQPVYMPATAIQIQVSASPGTPSQVFPHIAADTSWQTDFIIMNTSGAPVAFTLAFHPDNGTTIPIASMGAVSQVTGTIAPHGTAFYTTDATTDSDGWAELDSATPLSGVAVFREASDQTSVLLSAPGTNLVIPFDSTAPPNSPFTPYVNGVAIANADSANQANITCQAYDSNGNALGGSLSGLIIPPAGHVSFLLQQTPPFTSLPANTRGQLVCSSTTNVSAVGLRALGPQVSTMPVITTP